MYKRSRYPLNTPAFAQTTYSLPTNQMVNESFAVLFIFEKCMRLNILLLDFSLTVKAATLIFISGCGSTISSAKEEKSGSIYN